MSDGTPEKPVSFRYPKFPAELAELLDEYRLKNAKKLKPKREQKPSVLSNILRAPRQKEILVKQEPKNLEVFKKSDFYKKYQVETFKSKLKVHKAKKQKLIQTNLDLFTIEEVEALILEKITNKYSDDLIRRFLSKCWVLKDTDCWLRAFDWTYYNTFRIPGVGIVGSHRFSYELFNGSLIPDMEICHECDRKGCVNPDHLFQGTHSRNRQDSLIKGRELDRNY